jgi:hypothetical protein
MTTTPKYDTGAVNRAIAASRPKISSREGRLIHRLLQGRERKATPEKSQGGDV